VLAQFAVDITPAVVGHGKGRVSLYGLVKGSNGTFVMSLLE